MLKRTIKYTDFNDEEQTEVFYFNLNKTELLETDFGFQGGLEKTLEKIIETQDRAELVKIFKSLILSAYGEKSVDGKRFTKSDQIREEFAQSAAFEALFTELATDDGAAATFVKGILPKDMDELVQAAEAQKKLEEAAKPRQTTAELAAELSAKQTTE
jgi:hypothetical protein